MRIPHTLVLLAAGLLVSCSPELEGDTHDGHREILFSLNLDATGTLQGEGTIHEVGVYIFDEDGKLEQSSGVIRGEDLDNKRWHTYEGVKDIHVVANPGELLKSVLAGCQQLAAMKSITTEPLATEEEFLKMVSSIPANGLMMTGALHVKLTSKTTSVSVTVKRRIARIDLDLRKSVGLTDEVAVTSVELQNTRFACSLFNDTWKVSDLDVCCGDVPAKMLGAEEGGNIAVPAGEAYTPVSRSYTYPVQNNGSAVPAGEACLLRIEATLNGNPASYSTYIADNSLKTNLINPNTIYKVKATLTPKYTLEVNVSPLPWTVENEQVEDLEPSDK